MKLVTAFYLCAIVILFPALASSGTVGNLAETQGEFGRFSLGLEYDRIFDRDLEWKSGTWRGTVAGTSFQSLLVGPNDVVKDEQPDSHRIFLKGTVGLHPNLDIFMKIGLGTVRYRHEYISTTPGWNEKNVFEGSWDFAWGVGTKAKLYETKDGLRFMADAQYLKYRIDGRSRSNGTDLSWVIQQGLINNGHTGVTADYDSTATVSEWHWTVYANKTFGDFSPYAGIKYTDVHINNEIMMRGMASGAPYIMKSVEKIDGDDKLGFVFGTDYYVIPGQLSLSLEGRVWAESAIAVGMNYRF